MAAGDGFLGDEEVDFHPVVLVLSGRIGVEEQFTADGGEHLADDVFHQHAGIDLQFVFENLLVELLGDDSALIEAAGRISFFSSRNQALVLQISTRNQTWSLCHFTRNQGKDMDLYSILQPPLYLVHRDGNQ